MGFILTICFVSLLQTVILRIVVHLFQMAITKPRNSNYLEECDLVENKDREQYLQQKPESSQKLLTVPRNEKLDEQVTNASNNQVVTEQKSNKIRRLLCLISCVILYLAEGVNVSATGPFFPNEAQKKGVTQTMIGIISAVTMFALWFMSLLLLFLASEKNKKPLFYIGLFTSAATCIIFGELVLIKNTNLFIISCVVTRFLMGIGCACIWSAGAPILIPLFPDKAGKIFGLLEFSVGFGQMIGPPFGSFLFSLGGYRLPFWVAGLLEIAAGVFCVICLSTVGNDDGEKQKDAKTDCSNKLKSSTSIAHGSMRSLNIPPRESQFSKTSLKFISNPGVILITFPVLTIMCEVGFLQVALAPHLLDTYNVDGNSSGNVFLIHAGLSAVTCALFGILVDRGFASCAFVVSTFLTAIAYFILGLPQLIAMGSSDKFSLYFGLALLGITANGGFIPGYFLFEKIAELAKIDSQTKLRIYVVTWMNSCYAIGSILGQVVVGGIFFETFNFYPSCLLLAALSSVSFLIGLVYLIFAGLLKKVYYADESKIVITSSDKCNLDVHNEIES